MLPNIYKMELIMNKKLIVLMLAVAFGVTGCEVSKEDVMAKKYVLIAHNVSSIACSAFSIGYITEEYGLSGVNYHEDSDSQVSCLSYHKIDHYNCGTTDLKPEDTGYGSSSCAIGADAFNGGQDKNETVRRPYILVVDNVKSDMCGKIFIEPIADDKGYENISFYEDADASCNDTFQPPKYTCETKYLTPMDKGFGTSTCIVGSKEEPK